MSKALRFFVPTVGAAAALCVLTAAQARPQWNAHITGPHVTQWQYDQFSGTTAYAQVAVK